MGKNVEESEWDRYVELGLTGYVKYGYHQIVDYMPDELMLVSGVLNPLVLTGSIEEAKFNRKWTKLDSLLIKNNRAYTHGFTEGFWDFSLGKMEGMVDSVSDDAYSMYSYVDDVYNGRNTDNWLMMYSKFIKIPMKYVYSNPLDDFMNPSEKAKKVVEVGKQILHMNPVEWPKAAFRAGVATYNHYNAVFHSEEGVAQLFYNGGYGVGAGTGVATDFIVGNAVAQELTQIGGRFGKRNFTSMSEFMSPEEAESYLRFQDNGSSAGLRAEELAGIQKVDEQLALERVDYDEVLAGRNRGRNGAVLMDEVTESGTSTSRPTWRQSELDAAKDFPDYADQISFLNGKEAPYGTKGSVRPDYYKIGNSVDIKNYNLESASGRNNLARNIERQYYQRIENLPEGTKQSVMIDIRGQNVSDAELNALYDNIMNRTDNGVEILFKTD